MNHQSDSDLVNQYVENNDKKSFEELYDRHLPTVFKFIYSRCGDHQITQDVTSETFMTLISIANQYDHKSKFSTYACGIALNKLRQYWSNNYQNHAQLDENLLYLNDQEPQTESKLETLKQHLPSILSQLKPEYSEILDQRFIKGYSIKQTATNLQISQGNVKVRQNRAITKAQEIANQIQLNK